jgi:hypothetical protein
LKDNAINDIIVVVSYFFRKTKLHPKTEEIFRDFGIKSPAFKYCLHVMAGTWRSVKDRSDFNVVYENWGMVFEGYEKKRLNAPTFGRGASLSMPANLRIGCR